jgi:hypothetical protein
MVKPLKTSGMWRCSRCGAYTDEPMLVIDKRTREFKDACPTCQSEDLVPQTKVATESADVQEKRVDLDIDRFVALMRSMRERDRRTALALLVSICRESGDDDYAVDQVLYKSIKDKNHLRL